MKEDDRIPVSKMRHHPWILEGFDGPPPCYLPDYKAIAVVDEDILQQMQAMGFINAEASEQLRTALVWKKKKKNNLVSRKTEIKRISSYVSIIS